MEQIANLHIEKLPEGVYLATSDMPEGTLKAILKQVDITANQFLNA